MEWRSVDFPEPFSPVSMTRGCERSTIIGMWKFKVVKTGWARIFRYIGIQDSRRGAARAASQRDRHGQNRGGHDIMEFPIPFEVFVARITRKELKSDKFALEIG